MAITAEPATYHAELTEQALIADRHVLVEKPLALRAKRRVVSQVKPLRGKNPLADTPERFVAGAGDVPYRGPIPMELFAPAFPEGRRRRIRHLGSDDPRSRSGRMPD